jgi:hypothetical protein
LTSLVPAILFPVTFPVKPISIEDDLRLKDIASPFNVPVPVISLKAGWVQITVRFSPAALITRGTDSSAPAPHILSVHFPEMSAAQADDVNMNASKVVKNNILRMSLSFAKLLSDNGRTAFMF